MTRLITTSAACGGDGPRPGYATQRAMLERIGTLLADEGLKPFALTVESWRPPGSRRSFVARIAVEAEPGGMHEPLATWFQWRHPYWRWSNEPPPAADDLNLAICTTAYAAAGLVP